MKPLFYILPFLLLTYGCSKKVDSNDLKDEVPYYQLYEVTYNKTDNSVLAAASFNVRTSSGAKVELSGSTNVRANGLTPGTSTIDKARYTWTITGNPDVEFILTKGNGTKVANKVSKADISDIDFAPGFPSTISKTSGFSFSWTGAPLASDESMTATISKQAGIAISTKTVLASTVVFDSTDLQLLTVGEIVNVELYRVKDMPLKTEDAGAGGKIQIRMNTTRKATVN